MDRVFLMLGTGAAFLAVGLGAFGAHGLRNRLSPDMLNIFEVGVRYQMYHALAPVGLAVARLPGNLPSVAGWSFVVGIVIFSGSLYILSWSGIRWNSTVVLTFAANAVALFLIVLTRTTTSGTRALASSNSASHETAEP